MNYFSSVSYNKVTWNKSFSLPKQSFSFLFLLLLHCLHLWKYQSWKNQHSHHLLLPRLLAPTLWPQTSGQFTTERYAELKKSHLHHPNVHVYHCHLLFKHLFHIFLNTFPLKQTSHFVPQWRITTFHNFLQTACIMLCNGCKESSAKHTMNVKISCLFMAKWWETLNELHTFFPFQTSV